MADLFNPIDDDDGEIERPRKPGRPMLRDQWGAMVWDALWDVYPEGLAPRELRFETGLTPKQYQAGRNYIRDTFKEEDDAPIVYVRHFNKWFIAPTWGPHVVEAMRSDYLQAAAQRLHSAAKDLNQAKRAFPGKAGHIGRVQRTADFLRIEVEELVRELEA